MAKGTGKSGKEQLGLFETALPISETKPAETETIPALSETPEAWRMRRWREFTRLAWEKILAEAIESGDKGREKYARELLAELEVKDVTVIRT